MKRSRRGGSRGLEENARIRRGYNTVVRVFIIGFGLAIAAIAPVPWGWKIVLFFSIMFFVGIIIPAVGRAKKEPCKTSAATGRGQFRRERSTGHYFSGCGFSSAGRAEARPAAASVFLLLVTIAFGVG